MAYTLPEAIWLVRAGVTDDVLVAYPTVDRSALAELAEDAELAAAVTLMVDHPAHLDLIDAVSAAGQPAGRPASAWTWTRPGGPAGALHVGRTPLAGALGRGRPARWPRAIVARPGFRLVGLMSYEAQIAGVGDAPPGQALRGRAIRLMQRRSYPELLRPRGPPRSPRSASTPTWSSSTAAAPAAWPRPRPTRR